MATKGEQLIGGYLFVEGLLSILKSQDQRTISNLGRFGRVGIGLWLVFR
jgi:hypothetical protein